ncbi:unnamed protein product [Microthlaspi erraticum]|uniref:Uncharacterized protein n=1 Tax=Microthlaspi erraticum TaxID=1685480 RepID=A0A6D2JKD2_9BRAS|nr:unnamed protein product [Microthlaspi erraticum]
MDGVAIGRGAVLKAMVAELVVELEAEQAEVMVVDLWQIWERVQRRGDCVGDLVSIRSNCGVTDAVVPQGPVPEMQQRAAEVVQPQAAGLVVPPYLEMMGQMQMIGTPFFEGGVGHEEADAWRQRLERNFQSI